jgi:hypothetical protein
LVELGAFSEDAPIGIDFFKKSFFLIVATTLGSFTDFRERQLGAAAEGFVFETFESCRALSVFTDLSP